MNFLSSQTTSLLLDAPTRTQTRPEKVPAELKNFSQEWFRFRSFGGESYYIQNHSQRVIADPRCLCPVPLTKVILLPHTPVVAALFHISPVFRSSSFSLTGKEYRIIYCTSSDRVLLFSAPM